MDNIDVCAFFNKFEVFFCRNTADIALLIFNIDTLNSKKNVDAEKECESADINKNTESDFAADEIRENC